MKHILMIVDDADTRKWLSKLLIKAFGDVTITEAQSLEQAAGIHSVHSYDLAIVDTCLPDGRGIDFITTLKQAHPGLYCVVLTAFDDCEDIFSAFKAGAEGCILKCQDKDNIVRLLKNTMEGTPPLSPCIARRILRQFNENKLPMKKINTTNLTQREAEVLIHIAKGLTRSETARSMGIRLGTVAGYIKHIYAKLNVTSRAEAALEAKKRGLI